MEKRLKQQQKRLVRRVTLIMLAAWLTVSAAFGAIRLNACKNDVQKRMLGELNIVQQSIYASSTYLGRNGLTYLLTGAAPMIQTDGSIDRRTQLTISDKQIGDVADSCGKLPTVFYTAPAGSTIEQPGFLDRQSLLASMTDEQRAEIMGYLQQSEDYRLVCTKYYYSFTYELFPKEVQIVTVAREDDWNISDTVIQTYKLTPKTTRYHFDMEQEVSVADTLLERDSMHRNEIPADFILNEPENDVLSGVSDADRKRVDANNLLHTGLFDYTLIFDTAISCPTLDKGAEDEMKSKDGAVFRVYRGEPQFYVLTYARRVDLWEECGSDLLIGVGLLFGFFAVIGGLLTVLLWRLLKTQYEEEKKRISLTNALAHDIKTPLFVIGGYAQHLAENLNTDKRAHYAEKILARTEEVNARVHRMLDLSRLDTAELSLQRTTFDMEELLNETAHRFGDTRSFRVICDGDAAVTADRALLQTALDNLADNAVRYSPPDSEVVMTLRGGTLTIENRRADVKHADSSGLGLKIVDAVLALHDFPHTFILAEDRAVYTIKLK